MKQTSLGNWLKKPDGNNNLDSINDAAPTEDPAGYSVNHYSKCAEASTWSKVVGDAPADEAGYIVARCSQSTTKLTKVSNSMHPARWGAETPKPKSRARGSTQRGRAESGTRNASSQHRAKQRRRGPEMRAHSLDYAADCNRSTESDVAATGRQLFGAPTEILTTGYVTNEEQSMNQWLKDDLGWDFSSSFTPQQRDK